MKAAVKPVLTEEAFEKLLPENLRSKSERFFTPGNIAIPAARWLTGTDKRNVLDIGAGVGKFCLYGAYHTPGKFYGIEMRPQLVEIAKNIFRHFNTDNAKITHGNITDFQFSGFTAFYFYNPFQENIAQHMRLDNSALLSHEFYQVYSHHTRSQLEMARVGTRLATYYASNFDVPQSYDCIETLKGGELKFWVKRD